MQSVEKILTTHTGSLPRPASILDLENASELAVADAVRDVVASQAAAGIDIVSDGEMGKPNFFTYLTTRLSGYVTDEPTEVDPAIWDTDYPGFQDWSARRGGQDIGAIAFAVCVEPLGWKDRAAVAHEIGNLRAALDAVSVGDAFLPSASVSLLARRTQNRYYASEEEYLQAIAEVLRDEYRMIVDAGFILQIDAPEIAIDRNFPPFRDQSVADYRDVVRRWIEAQNYALEGIPQERTRMHLCWGNTEGPHAWDIPLADLVDLMLDVDVSGYCIEAANPRHAHEWTVWEEVDLPDGKCLIPGVIDTTSNYIEHPELVAQRLERFAALVGRENVIAGTDCGFGTDPQWTSVYEPIVWGKLRVLADGARLATQRLWKARTA